MKIMKIKKRKTIPGLSAFGGKKAEEIAGLSFDLRDRVARSIDFKTLTEEQKVRLRAAGFKIPEIPT